MASTSDSRAIPGAPALLLAAALLLPGCGRGCRMVRPGDAAPSAPVSRLSPDPERLRAASPQLLQRLRQSPHAYFRFVNHAWMQEVCDAFRADVRSLAAVRLHGDAHVEQYAVTATARGLDDFDDSTTGPAVIDLVRFLGSVQLVGHQRGWASGREVVAGAFLAGYRQALQDPTYLPPDPAVVQRLRRRAARSPAEFLAWAESLTQPLSDEEQAQFDAAWPRLETYAHENDPSATPAYLRVKRVGWTRLGIGSALTRKVLVRIEGPSPAPDDDVVIEGKEVSTLAGVSCLTVPASGELFRVVEGVTQVGRLRHSLVLLLPLFAAHRPDARGWWVKTWDASYQELEIADLASAEELAEIAHDVGAQLGSANLLDSGGLAPQKRLMELESVTHLEPRIRQVADGLTTATVQAWEEFRRR